MLNVTIRWVCHSWGMEEIGGYHLDRRLGAGGMGTVWLAHDAEGRQVAFKLLHPHISKDPSARARLTREVALLHKVRGPGVAQVLDAEVEDEDAFLVTELIEGPTLSQDVEAEGPFNERELVGLAVGLADSLDSIHNVGVVHRDLKPGNVMMSPTGPVLIDFGIAQIADDTRLTQTGMVTGTPGYLDPEVINGGDVTTACDWWSWAAVLAFAATGRTPFGKGPALTVLKRMSDHVVDLEEVEPVRARAIRAALHPDSSKRLDPDSVIAVLEGRWGEAELDLALAELVSSPSLETRSMAPPVIRPAPGPTALLPGSTAMFQPPTEFVSPPPEPVQALGFQTNSYWPGPASQPGWWPQAPPVQDDPPPAWTYPAPPSRGVVFALGALVVAFTAIAPVWSAVAIWALVAFAGAWGRAASARRSWHAARGNRKRDGARTVALIPWYVLGSVILVGLSVAFVWASAWAAQYLYSSQVGGGIPSPLFLWLLGATTTFAVWWGPGSREARAGSRLAVRGLFGARALRVTLVTVALVAAAAAVFVVLGGSEQTWFPLDGSPFRALVAWP